MKFRQFGLLMLTVAMIAMFAACGNSSSPPPAISVTFTPGFTPPSSLTTAPPGNTAGIVATIMNDPNGVVNWTVTCGSAGQCGSFSPTSTASTVPTTYTAPTSVPTGGTVTVTATSGTDSTKSVSGVITIGSAAPPLADGNYVFQLNGVDVNFPGPYSVAGVFTVSGGLIAGGEQDFVDFVPTIVFDGINSASSSIVTTPDGNLQILLDTGDSQIGVGGVETLSVSLISSSRGLITEFDGFATGSGTLDLQTSANAPSGGYAFLASGTDFDGLPIGFGGILDINSGVSTSGSVFDMNDAGQLFQDQVFDPSSAVLPIDAFGRVEFDLVPSNTSVQEVTLIGYVVDANTLRLVESADNLVATMGGTALGQGDNVGGFTNASLTGSSYVVGAQGGDSTNPFLNFAGTLSFNSGLTMGGDVTFNDLFNISSGPVTGGIYTVDTTGRATITGLTGSGLGPGVPPPSANMQFYLDGNGNAFALSMDLDDVTAGPAYQQFTASFSGSYATNGFGLGFDGQNYFPWSAVGLATTGSGGAFSGYTDYNLFEGDQTANVALSGTSSGSNNILTGNITGLDALSPSSADAYTYYLIDGGRGFAIESDDNQLGLAYFEALSPCANCAKAKARTKAKH